MPLKKAHCIDKLPWWGAALIAFGYLLSFLICVGVGSAGPGPANVFLPDNGPGSQTNCTDAAACSVTYVHTFTGLTGYNQALWLVAVFDRPNDTVTGLPALQNAAFQLPVDFTVSAVGFDSNGNKAQIAANASNSAMMQCSPGRRTCAYARLFFQAFLYYETYVVTTTFTNPYSGFITAGEPAQHIDLRSPVGLRLVAGTVNPDFTHFQIASKYTFFALSIVMMAVYLGFMTFGRGGRDPRNPKLSIPSTNEQMWVTLLGAWLIWANDPFAAVSLTKPSFAASGFYTFCAVTFGVLLLLYFLVIFDLARDPARSGSLPVGLQPLGASAQLARRCNCGAVAAAALFWVPKVIWCTVTWALLLSYYVIQRAAWLSDPTFDLFGAFPLLQQYFYTFAAAWGAFYVIYLAVFIIMALANCRRIAPSSRYIIAITLVTLIAFLVGYFMNGMVAGAFAAAATDATAVAAAVAVVPAVVSTTAAAGGRGAVGIAVGVRRCPVLRATQCGEVSCDQGLALLERETTRAERWQRRLTLGTPPGPCAACAHAHCPLRSALCCLHFPLARLVCLRVQ